MHLLKKHIYNPIAIAIALCLLLVSVFAVLWILVPPPPKDIEMATGFKTGLYYQFGERLKKSLAEEGVNLEVRATGGSVDDLVLLSDPESGVSFGMIQGGVADVRKHPNLVSIAGMFYEPVWVWYRESAFKSQGSRLQILSQLKGKRVSIGNEGSGTLALSTTLLKMSGIAENEIHAQRLKPDQAVAKLTQGDLDAVFIVAAAEAPILEKFYKIPGIRLMNFDQADAYTRSLNYLSKVNVPRGLLSIEYDIPSQETVVIAPTATLVARDNISPAMISLLITTSYDILKSYSRLQKPGEFPSGVGVDFPLDEDAEIHLKDGPSFLHRHLPFWTAVWVGRFIKVVIPLIVILIPFFTYVPSAKNFLLRLKLAQVYAELRELEKNAFNLDQKEKNLRDLDDIERRVDNMKVSMMDSKELYDLKGHVGEVRIRLKHLYA